MKEIKMYQCQYCQQIFKTKNRHKCKYDPVMKNCYSCEFNQGFIAEKCEDDSLGKHYSYGGFCNCGDREFILTIEVNCSKGIERAANNKKECKDYKYGNCNWYDNDINKIIKMNM